MTGSCAWKKNPATGSGTYYATRIPATTTEPLRVLWPHMHTAKHAPKLRSLGKILLYTLATVPAFSLQAQTAPASTATDADKKEDVIQLEAVGVTGSNIKRLDQEKVLPVSIFSSEEIEARDAATPMDLLIAIPEITSLSASETSTNAVAARGDNANVSLHGQGSTNTLVLLNGRRMPIMPFNVSTTNVNILPTTGVEQVEILRDGASSIYGSDAEAGVINYVTKPDGVGTQVSVRYGVTQHGGGMDIQGNVNYGTTFANGKGSIVLNWTAYNRDAIFLPQREFSKTSDKVAQARPPWNVIGGPYDGLTSTGIWPSFLVSGSSTTNWFYPSNGLPNGTPALTTTALPRSLYADYNQYTIGQPMSARSSLYNRVEYPLSEHVKVFGEFAGYISKSITGRQPITLNSSDAVVILSADNPYNPFGSHFYNATGAANTDGTARLIGTPKTVTISAMLLADGGPEKEYTTEKVFRIVTGLKGEIGKSTWAWEAAGMLAATRATDTSENAVRQSLLIAAALRTDATAWDPFGYTFKVANGAVVADQPYVNPSNVRSQYTQPLNRFGHSKLDTFDAHIGGTVVDLWAGPLATSVGVEWRREYIDDHKDPFAGTNPVGSGLDPNDNDFLVTSPKVNFNAARIIASAFGEMNVPIIGPKQEIPLVKSLEFNTSARYEHYNDFGGTTKPKFGVNWKPLSWLMVRGSVNQGFTAPDLPTLYQPTAFSVGSPPGSRDSVRNNFFLSAGLPADGLVLSKSYSSGNSALQPETSSGRSVGIAVDVPKVKGLSFTVDYWEIERKNLITTVGRDATGDAAEVLAFTQAQLAKGIPIGSIDTGFHLTPTSANTYVGDVNTLRNPVTDVDRALFAQANAVLSPANQMAAIGTWIGSNSSSVNGSGKAFTNGFDASVSYSFPRTPIGQFRLSTEWSGFLNDYSRTTPIAPKNDVVVANTTSKWKGNETLSWRKGGFSATISGVYSTPVRTGASTTLANYQSLGMPGYIEVITNNGSTGYFEKGMYQIQLNGAVTYRFSRESGRWLRNTTFRLGVDDLTDREPNRVTGAAGYSGSTGSSLWVGRAFTMTVGRTF
jgi:iron complex outermembrane receptor protein